MMIVRGYDLPLTLSVEKKGSPHKLVMMKTDKLHQEAKKRFAQLNIYYQKLESMACQGEE
jgi:hypothetical protein